MGKRRKHSKIDQLEPAVKETVDEMIKTGAYYQRSWTTSSHTGSVSHWQQSENMQRI